MEKLRERLTRVSNEFYALKRERTEALNKQDRFNREIQSQANNIGTNLDMNSTTLQALQSLVKLNDNDNGWDVKHAMAEYSMAIFMDRHHPNYMLERELKNLFTQNDSQHKQIFEALDRHKSMIVTLQNEYVSKEELWAKLKHHAKQDDMLTITEKVNSLPTMGTVNEANENFGNQIKRIKDEIENNYATKSVVKQKIDATIDRCYEVFVGQHMYKKTMDSLNAETEKMR